MTTKNDFPVGRRNSVTFKDDVFRNRTPSVGKKELNRISSSGKGRIETGPSDSNNSVGIPKKFHKLKAASRDRPHHSAERNKSPAAVPRQQQQHQPHNVNLENTYKLEPDKDQYFDSVKISQIIENTLNEKLKEMTYDHERISGLCIQLAEAIKEEIKASGIQRYKLVTNVVLYEDKRQGFQYGSRCLWNTNFDNFATGSYSGIGWRAVGACFASYYD